MLVNSKTIGRKEYLYKALKWYFGNMIYGLLPLFILWGGCKMSPDNPWGNDALKALFFHDGIVLFVSCTLMGATIIDFHLGGHVVQGNSLLLMYGLPIVSIVVLMLKFVFHRFHLSNGDLFNLKSPFIIGILIISIVYCIAGKFYLYLREEIDERKALGIN